MDLYGRTARQAARQLTQAYSTSFSMAARLFAPAIRDDIYAVYGLVRIADEVVDTYRGADAGQLLDGLESETYRAIDSGYSVNLIVQAFCLTARQYGIGRELIEPFFASMRSDLRQQHFDRQAYQRYIYGSAEVVGLMCLKVFVGGDEQAYQQLKPGAQSLGSAFQKVNFLRDIADDTGRLQRSYFPELQATELDESIKQAIIADIMADFEAAADYINRLPQSAQRAVLASYRYYLALLRRLQATPATQLRHVRLRIPNTYKLLLLARTAIYL